MEKLNRVESRELNQTLEAMKLPNELPKDLTDALIEYISGLGEYFAQTQPETMLLNQKRFMGDFVRLIGEHVGP